MSGKLTLSVYDDVHHQNADGIAYDLWRVSANNQTRVQIKHDTIRHDNQHLLFQANTVEELGYFEVILYIKDYFETFNDQIDVPDSRRIIPFGISDLHRDDHLNIHITPTGYTCTL